MADGDTRDRGPSGAFGGNSHLQPDDLQPIPSFVALTGFANNAGAMGNSGSQQSRRMIERARRFEHRHNTFRHASAQRDMFIPGHNDLLYAEKQNYHRLVGEEHRAAHAQGRTPRPVPLNLCLSRDRQFKQWQWQSTNVSNNPLAPNDSSFQPSASLPYRGFGGWSHQKPPLSEWSELEMNSTAGPTATPHATAPPSPRSDIATFSYDQQFPRVDKTAGSNSSVTLGRANVDGFADHAGAEKPPAAAAIRLGPSPDPKSSKQGASAQDQSLTAHSSSKQPPLATPATSYSAPGSKDSGDRGSAQTPASTTHPTPLTTQPATTAPPPPPAGLNDNGDRALAPGRLTDSDSSLANPPDVVFKKAALPSKRKTDTPLATLTKKAKQPPTWRDKVEKQISAWHAYHTSHHAREFFRCTNDCGLMSHLLANQDPTLLRQLAALMALADDGDDGVQAFCRLMKLWHEAGLRFDLQLRVPSPTKFGQSRALIGLTDAMSIVGHGHLTDAAIHAGSVLANRSDADLVVDPLVTFRALTKAVDQGLREDAIDIIMRSVTDQTTRIFLPINEHCEQETRIEENGTTNANHWSLLMLSIDRKLAIIQGFKFDSNIHPADTCSSRAKRELWLNRQARLRELCQGLKSIPLLSKVRFSGLEFVTNIPHQTNGDDCGFFVLVFMGELMSNNTVDLPRVRWTTRETMRVRCAGLRTTLLQRLLQCLVDEQKLRSEKHHLHW